MFTIISQESAGNWATKYLIGYNSKTYECIRNSSRSAKLKGVSLTESQQCELGDLLEEDFLLN